MQAKDVERLKAVKNMLYAMAQGNFNSRIPRTGEDDLIESITVLLNMMAEEMKETLKLYTDLHIQSTPSAHINMAFILNQEFRIQYISADVLAELGYKDEDLINESFSKLLSNSHKRLWRSIGNKMLDTVGYNEQHRLILNCKNKMERPCFCSISSLYNVSSPKQYIMVNIYEPLVKSRMLEDKPLNVQTAKDPKNKLPKVLMRAKDRKILQEIHHHISQNLDKPLPHLETLAHNFGTNEFKLKYGFKQLYNTTVFRFLKSERLKKGRLLLENTSLPVKTIAPMCGYTSSSHFTKDFKIEYGVSPKKVRE
ncbi:helix-turn-helix domain-containing protein [Aequorivita todarodis]|uniref:helix-turn-helix domain-containing protein n=1 Tax=Aequorivita todarodis TaxID=2036821 RepID=UPI002350A2CC|nr:helix-turn-helix domain-containing protein [Aequorivita todarodis]MDC8000105.1 helix-turn-helix domain-containing protein [Aequorivita todarodis]